MDEMLTRKEQRSKADERILALGNRMRESLSVMSQTPAGLNILRYILHESCFLAPLTHLTAEGMNKDLLLVSEAKRLMYLNLRAHMDTETIKRVELDGIKQEEKQ